MRNDQDNKDKNQALSEKIAAEEGLNPAELGADVSAQLTPRATSSKKPSHTSMAKNSVSYPRMWVFVGLAAAAGIVIGRLLKNFY
jgi:hypothetical protein